MPKRRRSQSPERPAATNEGRRPPRPSKRVRLLPSRLLSLPQELLLRILYQLPPNTLLTLSLTSKKLHSLASDPQIWKALFWRHFVMRHVMKFGSLHSPTQRPPAADGSANSTSLKEWRLWLDDAELLQKEREVVAKHAEASLPGAMMAQDTGSYNADASQPLKVVGMDWKGKFRLRWNWQRGSCRFGEVPLAPRLENVIASGAAIAYHEGYVFTAERGRGLQVWAVGNNKGTEPMLLCEHRFDPKSGTPTCVAIDEVVCDDYGSRIRRTEGTEVAIGFDTCAFAILNFRISNEGDGQLTPIVQCRASDNTKSSIKFIAHAKSYLCIMTTRPQLFLYHVPLIRRFDSGAEPPRIKLITTLACDRSWTPTAVSVRSAEESSNPHIIASAVFAVHSYLDSGDGMCIQELHVDPTTSKIITSRVAQSTSPSFLDQPYVRPTLNVTQTSAPTSTVYRYPFLMTSHGDNTLTRYFVSSADDLVITPGYRMWGHTAAVSGVAIRRRKAVSVDRRGEIRVWDLQGLQKCVKVKRDLPNNSDGSGRLMIPNGRCGGFIGFGEDEIVLVENYTAREAEGEASTTTVSASAPVGKSRLLVCNFT